MFPLWAPMPAATLWAPKAVTNPAAYRGAEDVRVLSQGGTHEWTSR